MGSCVLRCVIRCHCVFVPWPFSLFQTPPIIVEWPSAQGRNAMQQIEENVLDINMCSLNTMCVKQSKTPVLKRRGLSPRDRMFGAENRRSEISLYLFPPSNIFSVSFSSLSLLCSPSNTPFTYTMSTIFDLCHFWKNNSQHCFHISA